MQEIFSMGLMQLKARKTGRIKTCRILQVWSSGLKNTFKTQLASKELVSGEYAISPEHLEFQKIRDAGDLKPLRITARSEDTTAVQIGAMVMLDASRYPNDLCLWGVRLFRGDQSKQFLIEKTMMGHYPDFESVPDVDFRSLDYADVGKAFSVEKINNGRSLKFTLVAEEEETSSLAETVVSEPVEQTPVEEALVAMGLKPHGCRASILEVLQENPQFVRAQLVQAVVEQGEYSESTVRRHLKTLQVKGFIAGERGELTPVGFEEAFEAKLREICLAKGFAFG